MKLGIYGGTFNPIHLGHLHILREFSKRLSLEKILLIPTKVPPHKQASFLAPEEDRMAMCRLAAEELPGVEITVSDIELRRGGKSYTADTLEELHKQYSEDELYLLMGEDMFLTLSTWYRPETIFALSIPCASPRSAQGFSRLLEKQGEYAHRFGAKTEVENIPWLDISSTEIRERAGGGGSVQGLVPERVERYLTEKGLYEIPKGKEETD